MAEAPVWLTDEERVAILEVLRYTLIGRPPPATGIQARLFSAARKLEGVDKIVMIVTACGGAPAGDDGDKGTCGDERGEGDEHRV